MKGSLPTPSSGFVLPFLVVIHFPLGWNVFAVAAFSQSFAPLGDGECRVYCAE